MQRYLSTPLSLLNLFTDVIGTLLTMRFLLKLFGANPANGVVSFVYTLTAPLVAPFRGIFHDMSSPSLYIEMSVLISMGFFAVVAMLFARLLVFFTSAVSGDAEMAEVQQSAA